MNSSFLSLNVKDIAKGFFVAFLGTFVTAIYTTLSTGGLPTLAELKAAALVGLAAGLSYLIKNVLTNSEDEILKKDPPSKLPYSGRA